MSPGDVVCVCRTGTRLFAAIESAVVKNPSTIRSACRSSRREWPLPRRPPLPRYPTAY